MLDTLEYKYRYYETAIQAGTISVPEKMTDDEIPLQFIEIRKNPKKTTITFAVLRF